MPFSTAQYRSTFCGAWFLASSLVAGGTVTGAEPSVPTPAPKAAQTKPASVGRDASSPAKNAAATKPDVKKKSPERRLVNVSGGQISLDVRQWPLLGKPDARYVVVEMFDYTCPYCRATHQALRGAMERYGDDLAILALPVPLNAACNRGVQFTASQHADSCELARLAVAVWRTDRKQFRPFHDWLFESSQPRTAADARWQAAQLVGEAALAEELNRPYAGQYIAKHVELYERAGSGNLPKLLFPKDTIVGSVESSNTLIDMIGREFGQTP